MALCTVEARQRATQRTRNRIREHGPLFEVVEKGIPACMDGLTSLLVRAPDGWVGWLPSIEIVVSKEMT